MEKVYKFNCLSEDAKKKAAEELFENAERSDSDISVESELISEDIKETLRGYKLHFDEIYWDYRYNHPTLDLSSVKVTEEFFKKILSKEQFIALADIEAAASGYIEHQLYEKGHKPEGYELEIDSSKFDEKEAMKFLTKYSKDDDIRDKYKFHVLLKMKTLGEEASELEDEIEKPLNEMSEWISNIVDAQAESIYEELSNIIKSTCDYNGSEKYWYERLENDEYTEDKYLFNHKGELILDEMEFVKPEYEDIYINRAA